MYMTEAIRMMTKNMANMTGGAYMRAHLSDVLHPHVETQSADEIVADVVKRAGIRLV